MEKAMTQEIQLLVLADDGCPNFPEEMPVDSENGILAAGIPVYRVIADYQQTAEEWKWREILKELHRWKTDLWDEICFVNFKVDMPELVFCVDKLPARTLGHYQG